MYLTLLLKQFTVQNIESSKFSKMKTIDVAGGLFLKYFDTIDGDHRRSRVLVLNRLTMVPKQKI